MATRNRPIVATAAALASAAAVVLATPDLISAKDLAVASPTTLSSANYELTAFADITLQEINNSFWSGWGGYVGSNNNGAGPDPYYPEVGCDTCRVGNGGIYVNGFSGVLYYLMDQIIDQFDPSFDLDNYYFEIGWLNGGNPNATYSGAGALVYVGTQELLGADNPVSQLAKAVFYYGTTNVINSTITALATALVPAFNIGPVALGQGKLASLFYYGAIGNTVWGQPGLPAIWAYVSTSIIDALSPAAATPAAAASTLVADTAKVADTADTAKALDAVKVADTPALDKGTVGASKSDSALAADSVNAKGAADISATTVADTSLTSASGTSDAVATGSDTATADASDTGSAPSADASTDAKDAAAPAADSGATKTAKATPQNPVAKITGKIRSALGGGESTGGGKHRAGKTGSSSAGDSSSSSSSDSGSDK